MLLPAIGILTAASCFSTQAGHEFKAANDYVFYDDFRVMIPETLTDKEKKWHKRLKTTIMNNKAISPEIW